ncbi:MAG TPA: hypothetical protein VHL58_04560 [Thermoanaerobaculia bacterium]|nr:hypothetical protein [Thermoanaerobaculia bacterium]
MNLKKFLAPLILTLVAVACSSTGTNKGSGYMEKVPETLSEPDIHISQVGGTPIVARHETGARSVRLSIRVLNTSSEPLTLDRVEVQSMGSGAYTIPSGDHSIGKVIAPNQVGEFQFWVQVEVEDTILGANGPVSIRAIAFFTSSAGRFRQVLVQNLNDQMGR